MESDGDGDEQRVRTFPGLGRKENNDWSFSFFLLKDKFLDAMYNVYYIFIYYNMCSMYFTDTFFLFSLSHSNIEKQKASADFSP